MNVGIVDVGGGMRGIYAAGVFDALLDQGLQDAFSLGIGVSAGCANLASFFALQRGRNYRFYTRYAFRPQYMSLRNSWRLHSYFDMDYIYGTLSAPEGEDPFDYDAFLRSRADFVAVATDAVTGAPRYFTKEEMRALGDRALDVFKASGSIPFFCRPYPVDGQDYFDGALGDPVPVEAALARGCDRVVLVLTRPVDMLRDSWMDEPVAKQIEGNYPLAAEQLRRRAARYNEAVDRAKEYAAEGRVLIFAPDDMRGVGTLRRDRSALRRFYVKGYRDGAEAEQKLREFLELP